MGLSSGVGSIDRYWNWMEENQNWNTQAAVDAIMPYKKTQRWKENTSGRGGEYVTISNMGQRNDAVNMLNDRYKSIKNKDSLMMTPTLQMGAADPSAQSLNPKAEADVITPDAGGDAARPDFGGSADSGRNPAADQADAGTGNAGLNVDDKLQGRRRNAGGIRI